MRFVSLDYIVRDLCIVALQDDTLRQYVRVARAVRSGLQQVELNFLPHIKSEWVTVGDDMTAVLPADCVLVTKVGTIDAEGRLCELLSNRQLRQDSLRRKNQGPDDCDCTVVPAEADATEVWHNVHWRGNYYGELYGAQSDYAQAGTWRHNLEMGIMEFGAGHTVDVGLEVLVEYKAVGADQYEMIPVEAVPTIKMWALYELNIQLSPGKAAFNMSEFRRQAAQLKRIRRRSPIEWANAFTRNSISTVK